MLRSTALITLLLATSPLVAEPRHFTGERDGVSFDYTSELTPHGDLLLRGTYLDTRQRFEFTLDRYGHVNGYVGATPVSFDVSQHDRDSAMASVAAGGAVELAQGPTAR